MVVWDSPGLLVGNGDIAGKQQANQSDECSFIRWNLVRRLKGNPEPDTHYPRLEKRRLPYRQSGH